MPHIINIKDLTKTEQNCHILNITEQAMNLGTSFKLDTRALSGHMSDSVSEGIYISFHFISLGAVFSIKKVDRDKLIK